MVSLPPIQDLLGSEPSANSALAQTLATLFEASPILYSDLVPGVASHLPPDSQLTSYSGIIDVTRSVVSTWEPSLKAAFIAGHPRIGEAKNLSVLSASEQARLATPPEVLARLAHLNALYERRYPGLRYITFVNGRTRAELKDEMEDALGLERSLSAGDPGMESVESVQVGGKKWTKELERAIEDLWKIARSRLEALRTT